MKNMREHFATQLFDSKPISTEDGNRPIYGFKTGDKILIFMEQMYEKVIDPISDGMLPTITFYMKTCTDRDFDKLEQDYKFVRMSHLGKVPVLKALIEINDENLKALAEDKKDRKLKEKRDKKLLKLLDINGFKVTNRGKMIEAIKA